MFKISYDKKITMVQGDTGVIRMRISNYELSQGDEVRFAIANKANPSILLCQHSDKKIVLEKQVTVFEKDGSARIVIYPYDTEYLQPGKYLYEIQVKTKDGRIDTVVPLTSFTLMDGSIQGEFSQTTPSKPEPTPSEIELRFKRLENEIIPELGNRITNVENEIDSIEKKISYINPKMFGAIGDGVTDDTQALQNTIDYCINNNHNLKSDKLTYLISSPLTLNYGDKTLCFDFGMSTITTNTELLDYYIFNLTFHANQVAQVNEICNLILDCKEKINGVELTLGQRPVFRNCYILDPKKYGFHVISGALRTDNVYLAKNNFTYQDAVAFRFESDSTDNKINNVITKDFKYCIQDTGSASFYSKVHCWIKTKDQLINSLAFDIRSGYIENCFIDTYQTGIKKTSTTGLTIIGGGMFINSRFYNEDTNTTRPLLMKGENSSDLSSIVLNGFVTNATTYNKLTNKKIGLVPDDSLYLKTENFINLTQRNIFNATDNLPYISNGESSLSITNTSRYSIVKNIIKNKNGFLYIDIIVDKIDGDFSRNYVTTVGNFKTGFVPKAIENTYITNGVIFNNSLDTKTYLPIDVYITSNGDGGTIGVRPRLDNTDITSATRLIIKLVLEANVI